MPSKRRLLTQRLVTIVLGAALFLGTATITSAIIIHQRMPQYRAALANRLSQRLETPVSIGDLDLRWHGLGPTLRLRDVRIQGLGTVRLDMPVVDLQFSLPDLLDGERMPQAVIMRQPRLELSYDLRNATLPGPDAASRFDWSQLSHVRKVLDRVSLTSARADITLLTANGPRQLHLRQLNASLSGSDGQLEIGASARAGQWLQHFQLQASIDGPLNKPQQAHLAIDIRDASLLKAWRAATGKNSQPLSGGDLTVHADSYWQAGQFDHAGVRLQLDALRQAGHDAALLPAFSAQFGAKSSKQTPHVIAVTLQSLHSPSAALAALQASARIDTRQHRLTLQAGNIAAALLQPLLRPLLQQIGAGLTQAELGGTIKQARLTLAAGQPLQASAVLDALRISTPKFAAGPVSASYRRRGDSNLLHFTAAGGSVRLQRYLKGELPVNDLNGKLGWTATAGDIRLQATNLTLTSGASQMTLDGSLTLPGSGAPVADLSTHITTPDCSVLLAHVPQAKDMPFDRLRDWLPKAVNACDVTVDGHLSGPLDQMFAEGGKHLGITITGTGFGMEYKPGWPALTDAAGTIHLNGDTLDISIVRGKILGVALDAADIHVDDVREPVLFLDGKVNSGPAPDMLAFLAKSPLQDRFGKLVEVLEVKGQAGLDLKLRLPLKDGLGDIKTSGVIHTKDDSIDHAILPAPIKAVSGDIHFSNKGLSAKALHGKLMGVALTSSITPAANGSIDIVSRGRIALPENSALLDHYLPQSWLAFAHGSTPVKALLQIDMQGHISNLSLHSPLQGMALTLPQPLHKAAAASRAFELNIRDEGRVTLDYGNIANVAMTFADKKLQRALIRLGQQAGIKAPAGNGLWLAGQVDTLPIQAWFDVLQQLRNAPKEADGKKASPLPFLGADLTIQNLRFGNRQVNAVRLRAKQLANAVGWQIEVDGKGAQGKATWRSGDADRSMLSANFSHLQVNTLQAADSNGKPAASDSKEPQNPTLADIDPALLPAVNITVNKLRVGPTDFGTARIDAEAMDEGWRLTQASLTGGALAVDAGGEWTQHVGLTRARLNFRIEGNGLARLTRAFGYDPALRAQQVALQGALKIAGNDNGLDLSALNGKLSITLTDGTIPSIEPGASRLLGLLNIYALPRRLMFDFSDVVSEGLEFDKISGDFKIFSGDAFTDNLAIRTPSMDIKIVGRIGLAARDYDQTVTVMPKVGTSLTIAGTVLGGPVAGAAVFALQKLLQAPLNKLSGITYQLQGSWDDPKIVDPRAKD